MERGFAESRNKAQALIMAGQVRIRQIIAKDGERKAKSKELGVRRLEMLEEDHSLLSAPSSKLLKPGTLISENVEIAVHALPKYVSRGGDKLAPALDQWKINVQDKICLDVGSSTGGFTDCLLQRGAKRVIAVDVGRGQMHPKLRHDPRVSLFEKTHILNWNPPFAGSDPDAPALAAVDVSFISLKKVLPAVINLIRGKEERLILALFKPQFEVGPKLVRKGIVKDDNVRRAAIDDMIKFCQSVNLEVTAHFPCPVLGMKGNREEWMCLKMGVNP